MLLFWSSCSIEQGHDKYIILFKSVNKMNILKFLVIPNQKPDQNMDASSSFIH